MKNVAVVSFVLFQVFSARLSFSQVVLPDAKYVVQSGENYVVTKNYYLLNLFSKLPEIKALLTQDTVLKQIAAAKKEQLNNSIKNCAKDGLCYTTTLKFSAEEINRVSTRLQQLYEQGNVLDKLVKQHLIPSGFYISYQNETPGNLLIKAWEQDAFGLNYTIGIYAEGKKPNYPNIDSISFKVRDTAAYYNSYINILYNTVSVLHLEAQASPLFYSIPLSAALRFLELNQREQAGDYEPMEKGPNKLAYEKVKATKWSDYPYSVILIPGAGPDDLATALSAEAMLRLRLGAVQYRNRKAPFIVVSGGKVHPYKTKYCEAIEMKRYLIEKLDVPESAIVIDPHARHTTTNMRNTVRLMHRYGFPMDKPGLTCTTRLQSKMIETTLIARCQKELNEVPYKVGKRLTETEVEFYPLLAGLQINPTEPLDP